MHSKKLKRKNDTRSNSYWISHYLIREGFHLDYSIESFLEIERLFKNNNYLIMEETKHNYMFAISCYIGDVLVFSCKAKWNEDEHSLSLRGDKIFPYDVVNELIINKTRYLDKIREYALSFKK